MQKLFEDLTALEVELEKLRYHLTKFVNEAELRMIFRRGMDRGGKGYALIEDYLDFFKRHYTGEMPFSPDDINNLFKRHDKFRRQKVLESDFVKEILP